VTPVLAASFLALLLLSVVANIATLLVRRRVERQLQEEQHARERDR
jgi:membrane protein implicated in regulation of membrane protease activity